MKELIDKNKTLSILVGLAEYFASTEKRMYEDLPSLTKGLQIAIDVVNMMKPESSKSTGMDTGGDLLHGENLQTVLYRRMNE